MLRQAGLELMHLVMEEEVKSLAGERHQQHGQRRAHRWGKEEGYCVVDGQKVPIQRTRLRGPSSTGASREQHLGSYEMFQRSGPMQAGAWDKMMRGLTTRNYGAVGKDFQDAYGVEKSAVSENFIEASREKVKELAGAAAFIQRCQVHKKHNVVDHLPDEHKADVRRKLQNAYSMADYAEAKRALERLHRELMDLNPSAARSLEEGMEETLTVHKLRVPDQLRRTLCSTNVIESAFSIVETVCSNVKRWRDGDHIERWVGSGLLVAERQFRKVIGHKQIPLLLASMANAVSRQSMLRVFGNVPMSGQ